MLRVKCRKAPSPIHGHGLFLEQPVSAGTVLYCFDPSIDARLDAYTASAEMLHFGYINPRRPHEVVICGDLARWWNFPAEGTAANSIESDLILHDERAIVAARDLAAGEELTICLSSDADAHRKLQPAIRAA